MIMFSQYRSLSIVVLIALTLCLNTGCSSTGGGILTGPPPCASPRNCLEIKLENFVCNTDATGLPHKRLIVFNRNPTKYVTATFIKEYYDGESNWNQCDPSTYTSIRRVGANNASAILGCSYDLVDGDYREIRYRLNEACFDDDEICKFVSPLNTDIPTLTCDPSQLCDGCIKIDFSSLPNIDQKMAISELYYTLLRNPGYYHLKYDLASAFQLSKSDSSCGKRITNISYDKIVSNSNSDCNIGIYLDPSRKFITNSNQDEYSKLWFSFPPFLSGVISQTSSGTSTHLANLNMNFREGYSIKIETELEKSKILREDIVKSITAFRNSSNRNLVIKGDWLCLQIINIRDLE